ncbi:MAG TPA: hypothetical protein VNZ03_36915 [Terriglobales bacterium]|jgi:hypothetical protein|nr:hypothetical protein [Terriglobales bacterium]
MLKLMFTLFLLASAALAQSSSDGSFSVQHSKHANFSLSPAQMRDAESLYQSACAVVQHDFHSSAGGLHPHFTVIIGADSNAVHGKGEIWMKKWNSLLFAQGVVVLAYYEALTADVITQLGNRAVRYSNASVDVADLK